MKFERRLDIPASRESLWAILGDFPQAARCLPGVEDILDLGDGKYEGTMRIRVGPVGLRLTGTVDVHQDETSGRWNMQARAQDKRVGGGVRAIIEAVLSEQAPSESELWVSADIQFMGRLGEMGQPLIKRKAETAINEFAENLKQAVA